MRVGNKEEEGKKEREYVLLVGGIYNGEEMPYAELLTYRGSHFSLSLSFCFSFLLFSVRVDIGFSFLRE